MTENQIGKVRRFLGDVDTQEVIKGILRSKFLEKKETDVHYLAAQTLAVQLLEDAWLDMERYKKEADSKEKAKGNHGL